MPSCPVCDGRTGNKPDPPREITSLAAEFLKLLLRFIGSGL
jgi:hypothetical protein